MERDEPSESMTIGHAEGKTHQATVDQTSRSPSKRNRFAYTPYFSPQALESASSRSGSLLTRVDKTGGGSEQAQFAPRIAHRQETARTATKASGALSRQ